MSNREIKFRVWDVDASEMIKNPNEPYSEQYLDFDEGKVIYMMSDPEGDHYPEKREGILMQYTGLKDKHGNEIYEGDILKSHHFMEGKKEHFLFHEVKWDEEFLCYKAVSINNEEGESIKAHGNPQLYIYARNCVPEIIGNIYQNQELLSK